MENSEAKVIIKGKESNSSGGSTSENKTDNHSGNGSPDGITGHLNEITNKVSKLPKPSPIPDKPLILEKQHTFWYLEKDKDSDEVKHWKINHKQFIDFLRLLGFRRYDLNKDFFFVKVVDNVIEEVPLNQIQDALLKTIEEVEKNKWKHKISKNVLLTKIHSSNTILFGRNKLSLLGQIEDLSFAQDTKDEACIFYRNGYVKCSATGYTLKDYKGLDGYIFRNQIIERDFIKSDGKGDFYQFTRNISIPKTKDGNRLENDQRWLAFKTHIGYLMHSFFDTRLAAVNITDSTVSNSDEGRTGKSLTGVAISKIKSTCEIFGKEFDHTSPHKYSRANLGTQVVFHNDAKKNLAIETLFNVITDGIEVNGKYEKPFVIKAKYLITSNSPLPTEGDSSKDRVYEFELTDHYSLYHRPEDDFGRRFFSDWDAEEWSNFDNFMMQCICDYLREGVIPPKEINLSERKAIEYTNADFVEFMKSSKIVAGKEYNKKELHEAFLNSYDEYKNDKYLSRQSNFTRYLKSYANYSEDLKGKIKERRGDGKDFITFGVQINQTKLNI